MGDFIAITRLNRHRARLTAGFSLALVLLCPGLRGQERTCMIGRGPSMLPTLPEHCRLVVVRIPLADVSAGEFDGDIVVTRLNGSSVVHRAIGRRPDGSLVTRGDNNPEADPGVTNERNYVGIVVGFEKPGAVGELQEPAPRFADRPSGRIAATTGR